MNKEIEQILKNQMCIMSQLIRLSDIKGLKNTNTLKERSKTLILLNPTQEPTIAEKTEDALNVEKFESKFGTRQKMKDKKERKEMIKYRIDQSKGFIKFHREQIDELKRELDFINGHYDKTWEEEYGNDALNVQGVKE